MGSGSASVPGTRNKNAHAIATYYTIGLVHFEAITCTALAADINFVEAYISSLFMQVRPTESKFAK